MGQSSQQGHVPSPSTRTKTKTRTKIAVAVVILLAVLGIVAYMLTGRWHCKIRPCGVGGSVGVCVSCE